MNTFFKSVLAGICISLGGTIFLKVKDLFPGANIVGAFLFGIGLFLICSRGYNLFTGKASNLLSERPKYLLFLLGVLFGNIFGCLLIAGIECLTNLCGESGINVVAKGLIDAKMNQSHLSLFFLGFLCNIFIFFAVNGYNRNIHPIEKNLALFLGVIGFILCGTEHSIADFYYWSISGVLFTNPWQSLTCLGVIVLGNLAGALFVPLLEKLRISLSKN